MQAIAEHVDVLYERFVKQAARRSWSVENDIPWDALNPRVFETSRALVAETYCAVEMFVPDYIGEGIALVRECFGQAWFQISWAYEESRHGYGLREYLLRSGQRSPADFRALHKSLVSSRWRLPFSTPCQMIAYGLIQEVTALVSYRIEAALAVQRRDTVLAKLYQLIARDEAAHANFYLEVYKAFLAHDRTAALSDLMLVFRGFRMPGAELIPEYERRIALARDAGFTREKFLESVWFPVLNRLGVQRRELSSTPSCIARAHG